MRPILKVAAMAIVLLLMLPFHYLSKLFGPSPWPRRLLAWVGYVAGMRVRVEGRPLPSHVLFLANHVSWLDIPLLAGASGAAFVSKGDVQSWPLIGWLAGLNDTIFVARDERRTVRGQADALRRALTRAKPVALFPEGTTDGGPELLPFRASLLASLFPPLPGVKVQPVAIDYGAAVHDIAWIGEETAAANARKILSRRGVTPVVIRFLDPIDPAVAHDRKTLAATARAEILAALDPSAPRADRL